MVVTLSGMNSPYKLVGKVFGSLRPEEITISLGYRYRLITGDGLLHVPRSLTRPDSRIPNTRVWVCFDSKRQVTSVFRLSPTENQAEEKWEAERYPESQ